MCNAMAAVADCDQLHSTRLRTLEHCRYDCSQVKRLSGLARSRANTTQTIMQKTVWQNYKAAPAQHKQQHTRSRSLSALTSLDALATTECPASKGGGWDKQRGQPPDKHSLHGQQHAGKQTIVQPTWSKQHRQQATAYESRSTRSSSHFNRPCMHGTARSTACCC
jgi:hypothetical protein